MPSGVLLEWRAFVKKETGINIMMDDMEYLTKLLHKEWERSGMDVAGVVFKVSEMGYVNKRIATAIRKNEEQMKSMETAFKQSMALSKECYILLRFGKKIKAAEDMALKEQRKEFTTELDREESRLFQGMFQWEGR